MNREEIQKLIGGYATGSLTDDERRLLFEAALDDQDLFDALIKRHDTRWLVEIAATIGQYQYIAAVNNAFGMEPRTTGDQLPVPA